MDNRRVLKEDGGNGYSIAINKVEDVMRNNRVEISIGGGDCFLVKIHDKEFRCRSTSFPRLYDDEKLIVDE